MKRSVLVALAGLLLFAAPAVAATGEVTAVSVLPGAGRALVVIDVRGDVDVTDFTLTDPARLVIDVRGAQLRAAAPRYDGTNRAGIVNVRYSQYDADVVRVVLVLDALRDYELEVADQSIRLSFGTDMAFAAWSSTAMAAAPSAELVVPEPEAPRPGPQSQQAVVTASYENEPITGVIAAFAELSGRTIVVGKDIQTLMVTAEVKNQPWDVAFRAILQSQGLVAEEEVGTGIIVVDSPENMTKRATAAPTITRVYSVNFARADSLAQVLRNVATVIQTDSTGQTQEVMQGAIVANTQTNDIIITDTQERHEQVFGPLLTRLDRQTPQVSIQAKIISIERTKLNELGFQYDLRHQGASGVQQRYLDLIEGVDAVTVDLGGKAITGVANANQQVELPALELLYSISTGGFAFTAFLQALESIQLTDEQAEPLVSTSDNTQARLQVGDEVPIRVVDASAGTEAAARVELVATGIILEVTPHVTASRQILLTLSVDNSSVAQFLSQPLFRRQEMTSQLLVDDGQTAVVGGLTRTSVRETKEGIPFLQNLPFVGRLFGRTSLNETRSDLLVLITPRIVDPSVMGSDDR
ncbi:MAG TPA: AMIN domain-containing protein [Gemmatimonadales bacterium]|jgi:type IV pilus assembly protein PilQ